MNTANYNIYCQYSQKRLLLHLKSHNAFRFYYKCLHKTHGVIVQSNFKQEVSKSSP